MAQTLIPGEVTCGLKQAVLAIIVRDGRALLGRRRNPPLVWSPPAGFVEPGETQRQAVLREVREETGLAVEALYPLGAFTWRDTRVSVWAVKPAPGATRLSDREHVAWRWASEEELESGRFDVSPELAYFERAFDLILPPAEKEAVEKAERFSELLALAERRYPAAYFSNKRKLLRWILREIPKEARTVADLFAGSGVVSYALKARGHRVICNDIGAFAQACLRGIVANPDTVLSEEDLDALYRKTDREPFIPKNLLSAPIRQVLTDYWHNAQELPGRKRHVALALGAGVIPAMFRFRVPEPGFAEDADHRSRVERANRILAELLCPGEVTVYRRDARELAPEIRADAVYLDPPYPGRSFGYRTGGPASRMWSAQECWVRGDFSGYDDPVGGRAEWDDPEKVRQAIDRLLRVKAPLVLMSMDDQGMPVRQIADMVEQATGRRPRIKRRTFDLSPSSVTGSPQANPERLLILEKAEGGRVPSSGVGRSICFVGSSPGREEVEAGRPFAGPAGETLEELYLTPLGLSRERVYLANVVSRLLLDEAGNVRDPNPQEAFEGFQDLARELEEARPQVIVALGLVPAQMLTGMREPRHGWHDTPWGPVFVTYHPSAVRRFPSLQEELRQDLEALRHGLSWRGLIAKADDATLRARQALVERFAREAGSIVDDLEEGMRRDGRVPEEAWEAWRALVRRHILEAAALGWNSLVRELELAQKQDVPPELEEEVARQEEETTSRQREELEQNVSARLAEGQSLAEAVAAALLLFRSTNVPATAETEEGRGFNLGRDLLVRQLPPGSVRTAVYRTFLDEVVCEICAPDNGFRTEPGSAEYLAKMPPRHVRCRCWWEFELYPGEIEVPTELVVPPAARGQRKAWAGALSWLLWPLAKMRFEEMKNPEALRRAPDTEILAAHRRLHQWYAERPGDEEILNAHILVVQEMIRRGLAHRTGDLDRLDEDTFRLAPRLRQQLAGKAAVMLRPEVAALFESAENFVHVPDFVSLTGSFVYPEVLASGRSPGDVDVVIRSPVPDPKVEIKLVKWIKTVTGLGVHFVYEPAGPNFGHVPMYDQALVRVPRLEYRMPNEPEYASRYYATSTFS